MLAEQPGQVLDRARRLGGPDGQLAAVLYRSGPHRVVPPAQRDGADAGVAGSEPAGHRGEQPARGVEQGGGQLDAPWKLETGAEDLGRRDPFVGFDPKGVRTVERGEQGSPEPAGDTAARQRAHLAERAAAQAFEQHGMRGDVVQRRKRQAVEQRLHRPVRVVRDAASGQRDRG